MNHNDWTCEGRGGAIIWRDITSPNIIPYRSIIKDLKLENSFNMTLITEHLLCARVCVSYGKGMGVRRGQEKITQRMSQGVGQVTA